MGWAQWHFLYTRSFIVLIATLCYYGGSKSLKLAFIVLSLISFLILARGFLYLINFFENVYAKMVNLKGISKFMVMKMSVGLMVIQTLVTSVVVALNKVTLPSSTHLNADDRANSLVCEFIIYSLFVNIL